MNDNRIQQLLSFIQEQPDEPFNVYALAMEYLEEQPGQALHYLEMLLEQHPHYLPTYYQAATFYAAQGDRSKADMLFQRGLELARDQGNDKTFQELNRAYRAFQDEDAW
ncbi:tetratricopeptide repeat protein [Larkinella soli]|uniref:tetratricopeptide repeat protein n=1 Tax=Larkinella soli TaxID=1770527 RepID=UPI000FFC080E|nr:tetratricopeptide repeat protein [Larkinella soli]